MTQSTHARYQAQLALLARDSVVTNTLADRSWVRRYARFQPDAEPFATLVYESAPRVVRVDVFERKVATAQLADAGWLRAASFEHDECLTTLPVVLRQPGSWSVARYLPRRRCTLRFDAGRHHARYLKVYRDDRGNRAHEAGSALWQAAQDGQLAFEVPRPAGWDAATRTLYQDELPGKPVASALDGAGGAEVARRIGHATASLALSNVHPARIFDGPAQMVRSIDVGLELSQRVPSLASEVRTLLDRLAAMHARVGSRELRPIHGDPHADQWLDDGERLGLLDFESLAAGDPELDAAVFLAELDFEDQRQLPVEQLERAYADGAASAGVELNGTLLLAYRGHKRLAKALRSASAVRPDGDERAGANLRLALECTT